MLSEMLLFCNNLLKNKKTHQHKTGFEVEETNKKKTKVPNFILYCCEETNKERRVSQSYTWWRLVRFAMEAENVPERNSSAIGDRRRLMSVGVVTRNQDIESKNTYRIVTRLSGEQVIMVQLQGSTENSSQLFKTPRG